MADSRTDFQAPLSPAELDLISDVTAFVDEGIDDDERFDALSRRAFELQYDRVVPFRRLCDHRGVTPADLPAKAESAAAPWQRIPAVPVIAFRSQALHVTEPVEIFRSSGTTAGDALRSVHRHPFPELYRRVIDATFARHCLPESRLPESRLPGDEAKTRPMLSLIPPRQVIEDSSLGFMADHVLRSHGDPSRTSVAMGADGLDIDAAEAWVRSLDGEPGTVLTTAFALAFWLDGLEKADLRLELPPGSTLFETGGFKGRSRELTRSELLDAVELRLGLDRRSVVREYGMTELTGHVYSDVLRGGDEDLFVVPPFIRVWMADPETLQDVGLGKPGLVTFFDLANVGSCLHVTSQDLGVREEGGFRLLGRADAAQLRGCSLTAEELSAPDMV